MQHRHSRNTPSHSLRSATHPRRGSALIFAMVALLLASTIGMALLKTALAQRRQARLEQDRAQSTWLAESGVERAAAQLARDAGYKGETWNVDAKELGGKDAGRVVIAVSPDPSGENLRQISVTADFPTETEQRSRSRKIIVLDLTQFTPPEKEK